MKGATVFLAHFAWKRYVSIHAPMKGATLDPEVFKIDPEFQSTLP